MPTPNVQDSKDLRRPVSTKISMKTQTKVGAILWNKLSVQKTISRFMKMSEHVACSVNDFIIMRKGNKGPCQRPFLCLRQEDATEKLTHKQENCEQKQSGVNSHTRGTSDDDSSSRASSVLAVEQNAAAKNTRIFYRCKRWMIFEPL